MIAASMQFVKTLWDHTIALVEVDLRINMEMEPCAMVYFFCLKFNNNN